MMEKVAVITAWLPTIAARVAITKTGQNTASARNERIENKLRPSRVQKQNSGTNIIYCQNGLTWYWLKKYSSSYLQMFREESSLTHVLHYQTRVNNKCKCKLHRQQQNSIAQLYKSVWRFPQTKISCGYADIFPTLSASFFQLSYRIIALTNKCEHYLGFNKEIWLVGKDQVSPSLMQVNPILKLPIHNNLHLLCIKHGLNH